LPRHAREFPPQRPKPQHGKAKPTITRKRKKTDCDGEFVPRRDVSNPFQRVRFKSCLRINDDSFGTSIALIDPFFCLMGIAKQDQWERESGWLSKCPSIAIDLGRLML